MKSYRKELWFNIPDRRGFVNITGQVEQCLKESGVLEGLILVKAKEDNMASKKPIFPEGVRQVPKQFSWLDHRLIRDHHIEQCSHPAEALYLFLVTVGDARGLSYYANDSIIAFDGRYVAGQILLFNGYFDTLNPTASGTARWPR